VTAELTAEQPTSDRQRLADCLSTRLSSSPEDSLLAAQLGVAAALGFCFGFFGWN